MPTSFPMSIPHSPTGFVNQASLDNAFTVPINDLAAAASLGEYGRSTAATAVTLTALTTDFAGAASVTFTLASTRRVRIDTWAAYRLQSATGGRMTLMCAYNTGSSVVLGSAVQLGINQGIANFTGTTGITGQSSVSNAYSVLLTAGTYTAYGVVQRASGGNAADIAAGFITIVTDMGSS